VGKYGRLTTTRVNAEGLPSGDGWKDLGRKKGKNAVKKIERLNKLVLRPRGIRKPEGREFEYVLKRGNLSKEEGGREVLRKTSAQRQRNSSIYLKGGTKV